MLSATLQTIKPLARRLQKRLVGGAVVTSVTMQRKRRHDNHCRNHGARAYPAFLVVTLCTIAARADGPVVPGNRSAPPSSSPSGRGVDPLLPVGVMLIPIGALGIGIGAHHLTPEERACDDSGGCVEISYPSAVRRAHALGLLSGGVAAGAFGLSAMAMGAWRTADDAAPRTGPDLLAGTWMVGVGLSSAAVGAGMLFPAGDETFGSRYGAIALLGTGAAVTIGGIALSAYAVRHESAGDYAPDNPVKLYGGVLAATLAAVSAGVSLVACSNLASPQDRTFGEAWFFVGGCVLNTAAAGGLGVGAMAWIYGARPATRQHETQSWRVSPRALGLELTLP